MDAVRVIGGDGTNQVVGRPGGWMARLEELLGRPLSRVVCLCHHAEQPDRALFRELDGQSVSTGNRETRSRYACRGLCGSALRGFSRNNGRCGG